MPLATEPLPVVGVPFDRLLDDWHAALTVRRVADRNRYRSRVQEMARVCGWVTAADLASPESLDPWIKANADAAPSTINNALSSMSAFLDWLRHRTGQPSTNWAKGIPRPPNVKGAGSRACTPAELLALVTSTRNHEATPRPGCESCRWTLYVVSAYTGLRMSELRRLRVGWVDLDSDPPHIDLPAGARKARKAKARKLLLHPEAAEALVGLIRGKAADDPVFPHGLHDLSFQADLKRAGIARIDGRGRTLTFHGLRKTFATQLARHGVGQRAAMALLDHADPRTTANVYQDADLLPLFLELCKLPRLCGLRGGQPGSPQEILQSHLTTTGGMVDTLEGESPHLKQHARIPVAGSLPHLGIHHLPAGGVPATGERDGASPARLNPESAAGGSRTPLLALIAAIAAGINEAARVLQQQEHGHDNLGPA